MSGESLNVNFIKSSNDYKFHSKDKNPEFAFIGRSNVGKSSLINLLAGTKNLAYISSKPGKTRLINYFLVEAGIDKTHTGKFLNKAKTSVNSYDLIKEKKWCLVDLPGYGFARISKSMKNHIDKLIKGYILTSPNLHCLFLLIDSRHEPQQNDLDFINFLGENRVPFVLVFTKSDKIKSILLQNNIHKFKEAMLEDWETLPEIFITSAKKKIGRDELLSYIEKTTWSGKEKS